ncbi:MAG: response regulator [Desulfuromusa sp.]|jgi:DNA-binding NtrC family response regulator|nr:response regulator [Desulfuromusa sp.]
MVQKKIQAPIEDLLNCSAEQHNTAENLIFGQGETILLADNNTNLLKLGRSLLTKLNYRVVTAHNETQVLEQCLTSDQKIDLLILDTDIPQRQGENILSKISPCQPQLKALFYTVCDWLTDLDCRKKIGHIPVMAKPYSISEFSRIIDQTLH